ncbi:MAG TPA: PAS domain S-box protein, partial [Gillisia sp.]|nr:PAS domain S-box protein [Gillisia sp.]
ADIEVMKEFINGEKSFLNKESRFIHKNGHIVHAILSVSVVKNEEGNPLYFISQITDITPRKIAAQKLQEALAKLEAILDSSTRVSIIGTDLDGNITTFNKGAENLLGYSAEEMMNKQTPALDHLKSEILARGKKLSEELNEPIEDFEVFSAMAQRGLHDTREWTYVRKDGIQFPVQLTITPVRDNNEIIGYLGVAAEITEIKRVEKEIKSLLVVTSDQNERLKNFAHIVSHNLRSHSGNFAMLLELFLQDYPEAEENEIMTMLKLASDNLKETIAHLNEVVLINTNLDENLQSINLKNTVKQSIKNIMGIANDAEVKIINNINPKLQILGLPAYLDSIVLNFLTNGIKYRSLERDSYVKLDAEKDGENIILSIEDNGLGIDLKKHRNKIFGMYKTFHKNKDSRGIGLFITKNQIESLGGKIELESEVDKGTTFKIYFKYEEN